MAKKKQKGTNGYVAELNKLVKAEYNGEIPAKLTILIRKTAQDMCIMDKIFDDVSTTESLVTFEVGSMGQQKPMVNGLVTYYDKASARVTDDLYNLGLTARKQAVKVEDPGKVDDDDPMKKFHQDARK
jgi:hypothetical protein